jgi:dipeptidyl aminopeptidase/acylaminoacyl peptidase
VLLALVPLLTADTAEKQPLRPNYKQALKFSSENLKSLTYSTTLIPQFIGKSDVFWYAWRDSKGTRYRKVDPAAESNEALFDHDKLAADLAELSRKPCDGANLPISRTQINSEGTKMSFVSGEMLYELDLKDSKLTAKGKAPPMPAFPGFGGSGGGRPPEDEIDAQDVENTKEVDKTKEIVKETDKDKDKGNPQRSTKSVSPDGKSVLFTKDNNLYLAPAGKEKEAIQLSKDGTADYSFVVSSGFVMGGGGRTRTSTTSKTKSSPISRSPWSPDSKTFHVSRSDKRGVKDLFVIDSLANPRPKLEQYPYSMPGEDAVRKSELWIGSALSNNVTRIEPKWRDESYRDMHWTKTPGELRFVRMDRLLRNLELCSLDTATNKSRVLIKEGFEAAPVDYEPIRYLEESEEMIWWSERSGWGHYYLYDREGKLKNAITAGPWRASSIVAIDEKSRTLWIRGNAREKGENVYYNHLYRVNFDGTGLTLLDAGDADQSSTLAPSREFVVTNSMRVDQAPHATLRSGDGRKIMDLEKTDLSRLEEFGWQHASTFRVKAADGVTDLYGNMWKPFDFDPTKKYPIIAHVYPGPQTEGVDGRFSAYSTNMQLAQLGFIVIQVGHRGGSPNRSKAYASYGYFNLRDYALEDKKSAIEQLAARWSWIDRDKIGIYGHSGGGFFSAAAMMQKPYNEFFKAAVASAGNHDNNIYNNWWSERYHGLKEVASTESKEKTETKDKTKTPTPSAPAAPPVREVKKDAKDASVAKKDDKDASVVKKDDKTAVIKKDDKDMSVTKKDDKDKSVKKDDKNASVAKTKFEIKVPTNAELAANLKGRLLLIHGEIDNNVHPANTMRLVDALIKANKRFDLLIVPGQRHGFGTASRYVQRRTWEFFAEHLMGDRRRGAEISDEN